MGSYTFVTMQGRVSAEVNDTANTSVSLTQVKQAIVSAIEHYERERIWFNESVSTALATVASFPAVAPPSDLLFIDKIQACTTQSFTATTNSNATVNGITDTSTLSIGMPITGAGIPAASYVRTIPSSVSVTLGDVYGAAVNATASASITAVAYGLNRLPLELIDYETWANQAYGSTGGSQPCQYAYYQDRILLYPTPNAVYGLIVSYTKRLTTLSADADNNGWTNFCEPLIRSRAKWDIFKNLLYMPALATLAKQEEVDALAMLDEDRTQRNTTGRTTAVYL